MPSFMLVKRESSNILNFTSGSCNSQPPPLLNLPMLNFSLLPALGCATCCQTSNQTGKLNQIGCKIKKERQKKAWKGEGSHKSPQCATIYFCLPKLRRRGVTFQTNLHKSVLWRSLNCV